MKKTKGFYFFYLQAKYKIASKIWTTEYTTEYGKGYLYFFLNNVAKLTEDEYNEYSKLIDELK